MGLSDEVPGENLVVRVPDRQERAREEVQTNLTGLTEAQIQERAMKIGLEKDRQPTPG